MHRPGSPRYWLGGLRTLQRSGTLGNESGNAGYALPTPRTLYPIVFRAGRILCTTARLRANRLGTTRLHSLSKLSLLLLPLIFRMEPCRSGSDPCPPALLCWRYKSSSSYGLKFSAKSQIQNEKSQFRKKHVNME